MDKKKNHSSSCRRPFNSSPDAFYDYSIFEDDHKNDLVFIWSASFITEQQAKPVVNQPGTREKRKRSLTKMKVTFTEIVSKYVRACIFVHMYVYFEQKQYLGSTPPCTNMRGHLQLSLNIGYSHFGD